MASAADRSGREHESDSTENGTTRRFASDAQAKAGPVIRKTPIVTSGGGLNAVLMAAF
jgi:hypothetical protein